MSAHAAARGALATTVAGIPFQNPVLLAAGTAAYGREINGVIDVESLGGIITKAVSVEPRAGASAPRVADFPGGMINAIGLANPGVDAVRGEHLPWLAKLSRARVLVNVVGRVVEDFAEVVGALEGADGVSGYELNVSCPNTRAGGLEFGADPVALTTLIQRARAATSRPLFVKLSPTLPDVAVIAKCAVDAGADGVGSRAPAPVAGDDSARRVSAARGDREFIPARTNQNRGPNRRIASLQSARLGLHFARFQRNECSFCEDDPASLANAEHN